MNDFKFIFTSLFSLLIVNVYAGPDNIDQNAKGSVYAELNNSFSANNVIDGIIGIAGQGEWASNSKTNFCGGVNYP